MRALRLFANPRYQKRAWAVLTNSLNGLFLPLLTPLVSVLVVRLASLELWGEFVRSLIIVQLGTHVVAWGNKDYLLRDFSRNPARLAQAWQSSLLTRLALFAVFASVVALLGYPPARTLLMILWGLSSVLDQAYDVLVLYRRDFGFSMLVEVGGLLLTSAGILALGSGLELDELIALATLANLAKAVAFGLRYRLPLLWPPAGEFRLHYYGLAFPFFLLGFSGMVQSRIDLYCVNAFLPERDVGQYQVLTSFLIYMQSIAGFVLTPFVKGLYRLSNQAILRISARLFGLGLLVLPLALLPLGWILGHIYRFDLPAGLVPIGGLFALPIFFYLPIIYALFKFDLQSIVIKLNFLGVGANLLLNLAFLPRWGMAGALVASAAAQWLLGLVYLLQVRELRGRDAPALSELP